MLHWLITLIIWLGAGGARSAIDVSRQPITVRPPGTIDQQWTYGSTHVRRRLVRGRP